jgi:hypothetical protein
MTSRERAASVAQNYHAARAWGYDPVQHADYEAMIASAIDAAVAAFRRSPPPDLRVIHDGAGRVTRLLLANEVQE